LMAFLVPFFSEIDDKQHLVNILYMVADFIVFHHFSFFIFLFV